MNDADWWALTRWQIAFDTGWTLDTIEDLTLQELQEYRSVMEGMNKAKAK